VTVEPSSRRRERQREIALGQGMPEGHPTTTEVRVELEDIGGSAKMTMTHGGIPSDSPGAAGWAMAFHKLAAHLEAHGDR
jgi:hypothetical protein